MLETLYKNVMEQLFPTPSLKERFLKNKKISLPKQFNNMIGYPKSYFKFKKIKRLELFEIIKKIIREKVCRGIHPNWLIIYYQDLINIGYIFPKCNLKNCDYDVYEFRKTDKFGKKKDVRKQINESFKIHSYLLLDPDFKKCIGKNYYNLLITNSYIERHVAADKIDNSKYIDMIYNLGDNDLSVPIEVQESHHDKEEDTKRKNQIFALTGKDLVLYYIEKSSFDKVYNEIMISFSKVIMKLDKIKGITLYFTKVNNWNFGYSRLFSQIYGDCIIKKDGYKVKELIKNLKELKLKDPTKIINEMYNSEELVKAHFMPDQKYLKLKKIKTNDGINKIKIINENSYLNIDGVNAIIQYPRNNDWSIKGNSVKIRRYYSQFMVKYIEMIELLNTNNLKNEKVLRNIYIETKNIYDMSNYLINEFTVTKWANIVSNKYRGKIKSKLHPVIPFLIEETNSKVELKRLVNLFGKQQVSKWTESIETKKNIIDYRILNNEELTEINNYIESNSDNDLTDSEIDDL